VKNRRIREQRSAGMVLDPLAKVGVGMLMTVLVRRRQFVVDFQGHGKWRQGQ
jgi:hypothetical protein